MKELLSTPGLGLFLRSQKEVYLGRDSFATCCGEVLSLNRMEDHISPNSFHYIAPLTVAALAELRAHATLHVASAQWQEWDKMCDELLLDDARLEEATCRDKRLSDFDIFYFVNT